MNKLILLGLVVLFLLITACSSAESTTVPPAEGPDGKTLVEERCIGCHTLSRVISANHTADEWKEIVERMVVKGAEFTEVEQQIVLDYLIETYPK